MSSSQEPSPFAVVLAARLAYMMSLPEFHAHVWSKLSAEKRWRLYALRQQALVGDAPAPSSSGSLSTSIPRSDVAKSSATNAVGTQRGSVASSVAWYDLNGRMRVQAWEALRGTMTALVATETFCAEVLAIIDAHPCPALLPFMESALRQAASQASITQASASSSRLNDVAAVFRDTHMPIDSSAAYQRQDEPLSSASPATSSVSSPTSTTSKARQAEDAARASTVFVVRALQGDPAAVFLLWMCRAYAVPHNFAFEPITALLRPSSEANSRPAHLESNGTPIVFAEASDTFPFEASLCTREAQHDGAKSALFHAKVVVSDPVSAVSLLLDSFLSTMPNWWGCTPSPAGAGPSDAHAASLEAKVCAARARAVWLDDMRAVTQHIRGPILALQMDAVARELCEAQNASFAAAEEAGDGSGKVRAQQARVAGRDALLRDAALHLQQYEELFVQRRLRELVGDSRATAPSPQSSGKNGERNTSAVCASGTEHASSARRPWFLSITESGAAEAMVKDYFNPASGTRMVSTVDLYTATCAYVLCTNTRCQDLLPLRPPYVYPISCASATASASAEKTRANAPMSSDRLPGKRRVELFTPTSAWAAQGAFRSFPRAARWEASASAVAAPPSSGPKRAVGASTARLPPSTTAPTTMAPLRLPGVPDRVNELTNAILRGEAATAVMRKTGTHAAGERSTDATRHYRRTDADQQAERAALRRVRLALHPSKSQHNSSEETATAALSVPLLAEASLAVLRMDSQVSHAAGALMRVRLSQGHGDLPVEDLDAAQTAFPVLMSILTGAWALSQAQVTGFPYLWLNPQYGHFLADLVVSTVEQDRARKSQALPTRRHADGFYVRKAPESPITTATATRSGSAVVAADATTSPYRTSAAQAMVGGAALGSWQSKLRDWWHRATHERSAQETAKTKMASQTATLDNRTQVLQRDGSSSAVPAKL